jgi:hypothetical protein
MRRPVWLLVLVALVACSSSEPKPEAQPAPAQPAPAQPAAAQPAPAQPTPPPAAVAPPDDDGAIVIKGSKDDDASSGKVRSPEDQEKIDALQAQALASQGQDNGQPYRERAGAARPARAAAAPAKAGKKGTGTFASALSVSWVSGTGTDPTAAQGQVVVLEFWNTNNKQSRADLATLQALSNAYGQAVAVDAIALRDGGNQAGGIASAEGLTYSVGVDQQGQTALNYGISAVPTFVLVDKKGVIRAKQRGVPTKAAVDALVNEQ